MNGAQWFVRTLKERGVKQVFVLCGNGLNPFLDACIDHKMKLIDVRNEQAAAYMADFWGGFTGTMGVVAVSSGPGHTNAITGLTNAWWDGRPMMLVSGMSSLQTRGRGHFQELDQVEMVEPVCKFASLVKNIEALPTDTHNAIAAATASRPGPVHLTIPQNVFTAEMKRAPRDRTPAQVVPQGAGEAARVKDAAKMLSAAKRPIMVAGSGAFYAGAWPAVRTFAKLTGIPIYSLLWDHGCIEQRIPEYVGIVSTEVNEGAALISKADVILTLGARVDDRLGHGEPPMVAQNARFIRIDADPGELDRFVAPDIGIVGSPRTVLEQIVKEGQGAKWRNAAWLGRIRKQREKMLAYWMRQPVGDEAPMTSLRLCQELKPFLNGDTTFLLDGGNIGRWAHMLFFDRHPSYWFTCGISGVIAWGIPGALAAKLARPKKPVLLLSGDGSAGFTLADIQTAVRFGTPYVAVIAHDSAWGIVADGQAEGRQAGSWLGEIRYDKVAEALGARGVYIEDAKQIAPAIREGFKAKVPTFLHVPTTIFGIRSYRRRFGKAAKSV